MVFRALFFSHHIRESGFKEYGKFLLVETLDFGIGNTAQGIQNPVRIEKQNPNSTEKDWNPVAGIRNSRRGVQHSLGFPYMGQLPLVEKITIFLASCK